jgi:hypothetical protein
LEVGHAGSKVAEKEYYRKEGFAKYTTDVMIKNIFLEWALLLVNASDQRFEAY